MLVGSLATSVGGAFELPTIDEALKISQETGRPILALAGQAT